MSRAELYGAIDPSRAALRVSGVDAETFLQGLLTNDISGAGTKDGVYAALLTPQGKFLFDVFTLRPDSKQFILDVAATDLDFVMKRLTMYKLRADIEIARASAYRILLLWPAGEAPTPGAGPSQAELDLVADRLAAARALGVAFPDPRGAGLGLRVLVESSSAADADKLAPLGAEPGPLERYHERRVRLGVPIAGDDIVREETFPLEMGLDRIGGVDFRKGCYVGQEVSARMKHKATLKKGLYYVDLASADAASPGDALTLNDRPAGVLGSVADDVGLALLRADRATGALALESGGAAQVIAAVFPPTEKS